ncbi:MAG: DUF5666 domain-containing protein [Pseudomonadales bacterium]
MKPVAKNLFSLACVLLLAAWGKVASADGIGGSGVVKYFHSVVIDGVHYETDGAIIRINGRPASEADLKVGYHVSYRADGDTLAAWSMDYYDTVAGIIESVRVKDADLQQATLVVLGQRVQIDADTWLHGVSLETLEPGMFVAVSAQYRHDGTLVASSVDATDRAENVLSGAISAIDGTAVTIGGIIVDALATGIDPDGVTLAVGEWIHALGDYDGEGTLHATRLVRQADRDVRSIPVTLEGMLRRDSGAWWIRDTALSVPADLEARLLPGLDATVTGTLTPQGELVARDVRTEQRRFYRLDGMIEALDADGTTITVAGSRVQIDRRTSFRDDRDGYRWLGPDSLGVHDAVSLIVEESDGVIRARKVTRTGTQPQLVRAQVRDASFWRGPELLNQRRAGIFRAAAAFYDGRRIPAWQLRFLVRAGDAMTLRFGSDGNVISADVRSPSASND